MCRALLDDPRAMLFSYETAMFIQDRYVKTLLDWLGIQTMVKVYYIDGNPKYFGEIDKKKKVADAAEKKKDTTRAKKKITVRRKLFSII